MRRSYKLLICIIFVNFIEIFQRVIKWGSQIKKNISNLMNLVILLGQHLFKQVQLKIVFDIEN